MPDNAIANRSGLFTSQATSVPLAGVSIEAEVSCFCARVAVTQRYVNREQTPIEAVYVFPLDESAAVCGFEAIIDGTLVVGEVKEREDAFRAYDDAIAQGHGAFLLDEERPDVFQASIGNLLPGKEVLVRLTYVTELEVAKDGLRFSIPTTVSPRYAPAEDTRGVGRPDADTLNPPRAWRVPYGLDLSVHLAMDGPISWIESPSHPVRISLNGERATITLSQRDTALDRDFVLSVDCARLDAPHAWIERDDEGTHTVAVAFAPAFAQGSGACDVTFLVDRSGSMGGSSIEEVRNALQLCLRSMTSGSTFNIVGFGSTFQPLFPESRLYNDASLSEASAHVSGLQADLGGTEILPALEFVLRQPPNGPPRQVVVLTDGEVTNTDAVLALAKQHADEVRIFTLGIGAGASQHLVKGLARAGAGSAEFIYPGERVEPKVLRLFGRLLSPALRDVRVTWGQLEVTQMPSVVPPVFAGGRLLVYGFMNRIAETNTPVDIQLTATSMSGPCTFRATLDPAHVVTGRTAATLAARARIRELEESLEWTNARGSRQMARKENRVTEEIIALSMRYGLISRETSFVAIEQREVPVTGEVVLRRVPIALTSGWGGFVEDHARAMFPGVAMASPPMSAPAPRASRFTIASAAAPASPSAMLGRAASGLSRIGRQARASLGQIKTSSTPSSPSPRSDLQKLIALQRADGSWDLTRELARAIGRELSELEAALAGATGTKQEARKAWATALALAWLVDHGRDIEGEWRILAIKARGWLDNVAAAPAGGGSWADAASGVSSARA